MHSRRNFLRYGFKALSAAGVAGLFGKMGEVSALAAGSPYQALVCVYLNGGNDGHNMIVPVTTKTQNYTNYASARQTLALSQSSLLQFSTKGGETYGFNSMMPEMQQLYASGRVAVLANVGMLVLPLTDKSAYNAYPAGSPFVPVNLFSHSDQTSQWQTAQPNGISPTGWGGRLADFLGAMNTGGQYPAIVNNGGCGPFCTGVSNLPGVVWPTGAQSLNGTNANPARQSGMQQLLSFDNGLQLVQAANGIFNRGITQGALMNQLLASQTPLKTVFPANNPLAAQMLMAARIIGLHSQLGLNRQIFFCSLGGFDTHTTEIASQAPLLQQLSQALNAFYNATVELGVAQQVTTFTASEFGRTIAPNGNAGTDHAWGSHHLVMGGSVFGGDLYGSFPLLATGAANPLDVTGRGSLIPTTSVDQYAATLAQWFGVPAGNLTSVLPNIGNFTNQNLGFLG